jgi:hypothetical protein
VVVEVGVVEEDLIQPQQLLSSSQEQERLPLLKDY